MLAQAEKYGIVLPTNIVPGTFVQMAADNNDILEETLDGKHTTHSTTLVLYQRGQIGPKPKRVVHAEHHLRQKALKTTDFTQHIMECGVFGKRPAVTAFFGRVKKEWYQCDRPLQDTTLNMDLAWAIVRMCPTKLFVIDLNNMPNPGNQTIPSWGAFNALVSQTSPPVTQIGYCPMIAGSPTEFSVVYTVMKQAQTMMRALGQKDSVITFDLAIYVKAKEIEWRYADEFRDIVIRLGGFHIALNYLAVIGKQFQDCGLEDLIIESNTYGSGTASALLKGKSYNRGVRAHKLVMEAMLRLQWQSFSTWVQDHRENEEMLNAIDVENINRKITVCRDNVKQGELLRENFRALCTDLPEIQQLFTSFKAEESSKSYLFAYWSSYIEMIELLLEFIRAERDGNWLLHLSATAGMVPYFYSMDRTNYSRWLPIYLADMHQLSTTHPEVHAEFLIGNHSVSRSNQPFSQVWTDMALEQSVNLDSKKRGGIIGITQKAEALDRWFLTIHERAAITTATKHMCGLQENEKVGTHKDLGAQRLKRDEADVHKLLSVFTSELMTNPFSPSDNDDNVCLPLVNIATGVVVPDEMTHSLVCARDIGRQHMERFIQQRLNTREKSFWDPLPHLKLKTFVTLAQKRQVKTADEKVQNITADRELFGRLIIAAKSRDVDLKEVLTYELSAVPFALAHSDGTLRKNTKSVLLAELSKEVELLPRLPASCRRESTAFIMDGMAIIQMVKTGGATTFGELADKYWTICTVPLNEEGCNRVDIVFDRYDKQMSIKAGERVKRGSSTALEVKIAGENTPVPRQWGKYISNPTNKANLTAFICERWCDISPEIVPAGKCVILAGGFKDGMDAMSVSATQSQPLNELRSDHEEADTRMMLHALHASADHTLVVVQSPDTDVAMLCAYTYSSLHCNELWFRTGTKDKLRYIPMHQVARKLGPTLCSALPGFHALTGCDSTSALCGIGKKKAFEVVKTSESYQQDLAQLGANVELCMESKASCEKLVCAMYTSKDAGNTADDTRYWLFCQKQKRNENLPPTSNSLQHHIQRANYQALVWKLSLKAVQNLPSPNGQGWNIISGALSPVLMTREPAPSALLALTSCRCQKSACNKDHLCQCKANNLVCTEACLCMASEWCENSHSTTVCDGDSDEDI